MEIEEGLGFGELVYLCCWGSDLKGSSLKAPERERERERVERKSKKERESNVWVCLVFIVELVKENEREIGFIELLPMVF